MKNIKLFCVLALLAFTANAQYGGTKYIPEGSKDAVDENGLPVQTVQATKYAGQVIGTVGTVYTNEELVNLPTRNINKIASLTLGVQYQGNGTPIIRGGEGGTAYFVDGIRIRSTNLAITGYGF